MQNTETVVNRIIGLDARAEEIRTGAQVESESIRGETRRLAEDEKAALEKRVAAKIAAIEAEAAGLRNAESMKVKKEYDGKIEAVNRTDSVRIDRAVDMILSRIKGAAR